MRGNTAKECSLKVASSVADRALKTLANPALGGLEKRGAWKLLAGYGWNKAATKTVRAT